MCLVAIQVLKTSTESFIQKYVICLGFVQSFFTGCEILSRYILEKLWSTCTCTMYLYIHIHVYIHVHVHVELSEEP